MSEARVRRVTEDARLLPTEVYGRALEVGRRAAGRSGPNPPVGCLVVRDGRIVAEGATRPAGGPHAEVVALEAAGAEAQGAVLVVTLEPCAHHGRTPPCTEAIVEAGVAAVHVLSRDPDPVAAGGAERLRRSGVAVVEVGAVLPELAAAAAHDLRGFVARVRHGRPHVHLKLAQDVEGRTVPAGARYLTGAEARRRVHALRADVDAVLVGGATVRADDPRLDVRDIVSDARPRPVVVSAMADVPDGAAVVRPGALVVAGGTTPPERRDMLVARGVEVLAVPVTPDGVDVDAAMRALLEQRILTVLAEPGPRLAEALLAVGAVDVVELHVAGGAGVTEASIRPAIAGVAPMLAAGATVAREVTSDGDLLLRAEVGHDGDAADPASLGGSVLAEVR